MLSWFFRILSSFLFLSLVVLLTPLAFDVGSRSCGLAFSLSLSVFYFFYSTLRLATPRRSRFRYALVQLVASLQWFVIPALMIWSLNKFSVDSNSSTSQTSGWVERTFSGKRAADQSVPEWLFGHNGLVETVSIASWDRFLRWSIPFFQLAEGFCSLLVIQAAGQITRWLVNRESGDTWMIALLVFSASIISSSVYFLYRITTFPELGNVDAVLIGVAVTCVIFLCGWGIGSGRGNAVESSLLFAYVTLCVYQIFTDYRPATPQEPGVPLPQPDFPPLPPIIMASYTTLMQILSTLPSTIHSAFHFVTAAVMTVTPSVIISLAYRVFVLYASTRIIPAVRESGARALSQEPSLEDSDGVGQVLGLASWYSPSILIAVYTSLLMQHFASTGVNAAGADWWTNRGGDVGGNIWRWANLGITMLLYAVELYIGERDNDGLTSHWKCVPVFEGNNGPPSQGWELLRRIYPSAWKSSRRTLQAVEWDLVADVHALLAPLGRTQLARSVQDFYDEDDSSLQSLTDRKRKSLETLHASLDEAEDRLSKRRCTDAEKLKSKLVHSSTDNSPEPEPEPTASSD